MKIKVSNLRRLVREAIREDADVIWGTKEELDQSISHMDASSVAEKDYVDSDTGEIYLEKGNVASTSSLHPEYAPVRRPARRGKSNVTADDDAWEKEDEDWYDVRDNADELDRQKSQEEFDAAVKLFADGAKDYSSDLTSDEMTPADIAPDMAENFFFNNPTWKHWANQLDMTRADMKSLVADMVYEAMSSVS